MYFLPKSWLLLMLVVLMMLESHVFSLPLSRFSCHNPTCDCNDNGQCVNGACSCNPGYYGAQCELSSDLGQPCNADFPCFNGGTCNTITGHCDCPREWTGALCEYETRGFYCTDSRDCQGEGVCDMRTGHCVCQLGSFGRDCGLTVDFGKPCGGSMCLNGGICALESKRCKCAVGWTGDYCEIPSNGYQCQTNVDCGVTVGQCDHSTRNCICRPGYFGIACEVSDRHGKRCTPNSCQNGGACTSFGRCLCTKEWAGDFCEYPSLEYECESNDVGCSGNGICDRSTKQCRCNDGYYGIRCEVPPSAGKSCLNNCKNGGVCSLSTHHCICPSGWTGNFCEIDSTGWMCNNDRCDCNGNGVCNMATGNCICYPGFTGENCTRT